MPAVLSLYRSLLRAHREKLPGPMQVLGNSYIRHEFSSHLKAKTTTQQWKEFGAQWQRYLEMIQGQAQLDGPGSGNVFGSSGELPHDVYDALSDEQRTRVEALRVEAVKLSTGGHSSEGSDGNPPK
ncbi:MAG: hypothetical protein WDW38_005853 [Sanguina aurantia]